MIILNQYKGDIIIGISCIFALMGIFFLIKKPKSLSRFEAFWTCLVLFSEGSFLGTGVDLQKSVLEMIFLGVAIFLLWIIILFLFRRPKFDYRGTVIATCLFGIILYLVLFYISSLNIIPLAD